MEKGHSSDAYRSQNLNEPFVESKSQGFNIRIVIKAQVLARIRQGLSLGLTGH